MSAVSNFHTMSGGNDYSFRFSYDTSLLGEALGSVYDELRDYHDYNIGFGGPLVPGNDFIKFWFSAQSTSSGSYRVYKFDDVVYDTRYDVLSSLGFSNEQIENGPNIYLNDLLGYRGDLINRPYQLGGPVDQDPNWERNKYLLTYPWDNTAGYRGFGFDKTDDYFFKTTMNFSKQIKVNFSYWNVAAHRKNFGYNRFLYWDQGQNEIFRDTERYALEFNHTLNTTTFYTIRLSKFQQDQFIGVRMNDNDNDGYPDWFEWSNPAGYSDYSDPKNPDLVPFQFNESGDEIIYIAQDGLGLIHFQVDGIMVLVLEIIIGQLQIDLMILIIMVFMIALMCSLKTLMVMVFGMDLRWFRHQFTGWIILADSRDVCLI